MAVAVSRPSGRRSDDVRALKFRFRTLTFSGNYATGGEVIQLSSAPGVTRTPNVGLTRILAVIPLDAFIAAPGAVTGILPKFDVAADGKSVTIRGIEDNAGVAGAPFGQEKNNAEAYIASSKIDVLLIGE